jgi:hypothetical protein
MSKAGTQLQIKYLVQLGTTVMYTDKGLGWELNHRNGFKTVDHNSAGLERTTSICVVVGSMTYLKALGFGQQPLQHINAYLN